ncbi:MAG: O-antigen ligase family protein [Gemmatimonadales bacterium]
MIAACTYLLALLYCFVWLRIPEAVGLVLPFQRLVAWAGLGAFVVLLTTGRPLRVGRSARLFLRFTVLFVAMLIVNLFAQATGERRMYALYFLMDFSKYLAIFSAAFVTYYALRRGLVDENGYVRCVMLSGVASLVVLCLLVALYYLGFRTDIDFLAHSFGGVLGVWPIPGSLPRLAGTTAEPQQLSVVYLTPLMLMLSPEHLRRYKWFALLGVVVLILSQSKFAVVSLLLIYLFVLATYPRARMALIAAGILLAPVAGAVLIRLPTFSALLTEGVGAGAFVERLQNLFLLLSIARDHLLFGIGAGQYGVYRGEVLFGDPLFNPGYTPNMDFLKVLAEVGLVGFLVVTAMLVGLLYSFIRSRSLLPPQLRPRFLAFLLGAVGILLNMLVGYELLHVFFWLNVGFLLYLCETAREGGPDVEVARVSERGGVGDPVGAVGLAD